MPQWERKLASCFDLVPGNLCWWVWTTPIHCYMPQSPIRLHGRMLLFKKDSNLCLDQDKYLVYARYFWQLSVHGQSEVIRCISDFLQPCMADHRVTLTNVWAFMVNYNVIQSAFDCYKVFKVILRSFGKSRFLTTWYQKQLVVERSWPKFGSLG